MRNASLTLLALVAVCGSAAAQEAPLAEHRGFLGGGILLASDQFVDAGFAVEASVALPRTPLSVFVLGSLGSASDLGGRGEFARVAGGLEASTCRSRRTCVFAGLEVGFQRQTWNNEDNDLMAEQHRGVLVGPRFGFEMGGHAVRFRMSLDLLQYRHQSSVDDTRWQPSSGITMAIVRRI